MKLVANLIVFMLFLQMQAIAQTRSNLDFTVPLKERKIAARELVNIILKVKNNQQSVSKAWIRVVSDKALQLVSKEVIQLAIRPGDSLFIPVKLFVPENTPSGRDYITSFVLEDESGVLHKENCKLMMEIDKNVVMMPQVSSVILTSVNDSISIPIRVTNRGNNEQKVSILARFPTPMQGNGFHNSVQLTMRAFSDTTIYIRKRVTRELLSNDSFSAVISGIYLNGDIFSQASVDIQTLKSVRYNHVPSEADEYYNSYDNRISLSGQSLGRNSASYQITGGGAIYLPHGRVGYNVDAQVYRTTPNEPYIRNTSVSYETKQMGFSVGNISRNFDLNMNGRGGTAYLTDSSRKNHYEVGYIDNSSNLIQYNNFRPGTGRSAWGKYEFKGKMFSLRSTAVYNKDPFVRADNMLLSNDFYLNLKKLRISGILSGGSGSEIGNRSNTKLGMLGSFNISGAVGKFNVSSSNLISSSYYPGIRKGAMVFSERLTYSFKGMNIWSSLNYFSNDPKYISNSYFLNNKAWNSKAEVGLSKIFNKVSISLVPTYQTEYGSYMLAVDKILSATTESFRLATQISFSTLKQSIYIGIEAGKINNTLTDKPESQLKISGSYKYGIFSLNGNFQQGTFLVNEVLNGYLFNTDNARSINITPTIQKTFFRSKARVEFGFSFNKTSVSGSNTMATGRAEYNMNTKTQLFAALTRSGYSFNQFQYNYNNFQFGITQKIPESRVGSKNSHIDVVLYKDINQNGVRDNGDADAKGYLVYINGVAFITESDGKITYKNLEDGLYTVSVAATGEWFAVDQRVTINKKNLKLEIPLTKTGSIKGSVLYAFNEFSYEVSKQKSGITVQAVDANGVVVKTKTDDSGRFNFFLPTGTYTLAVDMSGLPDQISCKDNDQVFAISPEKTENVKFELVVKGRKIETKKFISTKEREKEAIRDNDRDKDRDRDKDKQKR